MLPLALVVGMNKNEIAARTIKIRGIDLRKPVSRYSCSETEGESVYYSMIVMSALLFSLQFMFNNGYQRESGNDWCAALKFSLYSSVAGLILLFVINRLCLEVTFFSFAVAFVYGIVNVALGYSSIKALTYANLSVYSIFSMIGGMILPFLYGIFCGEALSAAKLICCGFIAASVLLGADRGKQSEKAFGYYSAVFFLNGMVGVISKFHQSRTELCVDSASFMMLTKTTTIFLSLVLILMLKKKSFSVNKKAAALCVGYSVFNSMGNLMLLIALCHLPASVQYPIVTGGVIVFSTVIALLQKAHVTKKEILAAAVALLSSVFMAF